MIESDIPLAWILERMISKFWQKAPLTSAANFRKMLACQRQQLATGGWHFRFDRYGQLCAAAHVCQLGKAQLAQALKEGPDLFTDMDCATSVADQPRQLVLMDFWCEPGQGKAFIEHLRDQLKPQHESIVYFRIKNGKRIAKMLTRNDATTFMRASQAARVDEGTPFLQTAAARDFYLPTYNTQMAFAQRVGEMALLMVHAPVAAVSPLKPVLERIQTCVRLEQHRVYASTDGAPKGLVTWAWLTSKRLRTDSFDTNALQAFEWSEGQHLAVVDVVIDTETEVAVWADLAGLLYPNEDIWLLCKVGGRTFFKKWAKHQRQDLLTKPQARAAIVWGHWRDITQEPPCVQ